jgi:hypothetical protein
MGTIKKFNEMSDEFNIEPLSGETVNFDIDKKEVLRELDNFMNKYEELSRVVSTKNWRTTGNHFSEMRKIRREINALQEMSPQERVDLPDWAQEELGGYTPSLERLGN